MRGNLTDLKINVGRVNWYFVVQRKYFSSNVECGTFLPSTKFLLQLWTIQFEQMTHELIPCFSPNDSIARENYNQSETCYSRDNVRANHIIFNTFLEKPHELGHDFLRRQHTDLHRFFFSGERRLWQSGYESISSPESTYFCSEDFITESQCVHAQLNQTTRCICDSWPASPGPRKM